MLHSPMTRRPATSVRIAALLLVVLSQPGCMSPAMKAVTNARGGEAIGGKIGIVYSSRYQISFGGIERLHPFDIRKYEKIYQALVDDGLVTPSQVFVPSEASREDLLRVHSAAYLDKRLQSSVKLAEYLEIGFLAAVPAFITDGGVLRPFRYATGGTLLATELALDKGIGINLAGGYHHAELNRGGGFCIYADMPVAVRKFMANGRIHRVLMIDVDVHQGNGTALCLANDPDIFTFDMHQLDIYPWPKEDNDLDVPLSSGMHDEPYLMRLRGYLPGLFERAKPDIVYLQAGVDSLAGDPLADMNLTIDGIIQRDAMIVEAAVSRHVPIVMTLGGGYSKDAWRAQYESIANLIRKYGVTNPAE